MSSCPVPTLAIKPKHLHISLAGPDGMRVAWKTDAKPKSCTANVETIRAHADKIVQYLDGHGYHGVATLKGLVPGQRYVYQVVCDGVASDSKVFALPKPDLDKFSMLVIGDMGTHENGHAVDSKKRIDALLDSVDLSTIVGDIAYADDAFMHKANTPYFTYEAVYDQYMEWMENVMSTKPFMTAVGNHESECHSPNCVASAAHHNALRNFTAYNTRWHMPSLESGGVLNMWYSFDYGPVHFVVINSETDFSGAEEEHYGDSCGPSKGAFCLPAGGFAPEGEYLRWLEADLVKAHADRAQRPWIVAIGHRPWIKIQSGLGPTEAGLNNTHRPLFEKYGVDLYLTGHWHSYGSLVPEAGSKSIPIVITGAAGCDEGLDGAKSTANGTAQGYRYNGRGDIHQVGTLDVTRSSLTWKSHNSATGEVFDSFTVLPRVSEIVV